MSIENELTSQDYRSYGTLAEADNAIVLKSYGLQVYIISEDLFYYWNGSNWAQQAAEMPPLDPDLVAIAALTGVSGFLKTDGAGVWSVDTNTYLTGNQTITLSGDISGVGTIAITTTIGVGKVTNTMLAGSIDYSKLILTGSILNADLAGSIAASKLVGTDITIVGTITTGTWSATTIAVIKGGTGFASYSIGDLLYADTTTTLAKLPIGTANKVLTTNGSVPSWNNVSYINTTNELQYAIITSFRQSYNI